MSEEIWRDICGYEGLYQVSNCGRVKRFHKTTPPRILKPGLNTWGYLKVSLSRNNENETQNIHRLVAQAFIPNPDGKPQVNHKDGDKTNNCVDNLEWCTHEENNRHAIATGLRSVGENVACAKLTNEQARFIRENPDKLLQRQLAELFGVDQTLISQIQLGKKYRNAGGKIRTTKLPNPRRLPDDIREQIRREYVYGSREFGLVTLARKYTCNPTTISNIVHGK